MMLNGLCRLFSCEAQEGAVSLRVIERGCFPVPISCQFSTTWGANALLKTFTEAVSGSGAPLPLTASVNVLSKALAPHVVLNWQLIGTGKQPRSITLRLTAPSCASQENKRQSPFNIMAENKLANPAEL